MLPEHEQQFNRTENEMSSLQVKLVTSTMPEGLSIGEEGDPQNDQQVQSMFFNMMTGNIQVTQQLNKKLVKKS